MVLTMKASPHHPSCAVNDLFRENVLIPFLPLTYIRYTSMDGGKMDVCTYLRGARGEVEEKYRDVSSGSVEECLHLECLLYVAAS